jgi:hypothetical protein
MEPLITTCSPWFVRLDMDEPILVPTVCTKTGIAFSIGRWLGSSCAGSSSAPSVWTSDENVTVAGTLIEASANVASTAARSSMPFTPTVKHVAPPVSNGLGLEEPAGGPRNVKLRGRKSVDSLFVFASAAVNLLRLPKLIALASTTA